MNSKTARELRSWTRLRWAVRAVILLVSAVSVSANVLHAQDNPISQAIAAWPPLALLLAVELQSRIPATVRVRAVVRILGTGSLATIAAWMSYWHMVGVTTTYGEVQYGSQYLWPLIVDGVMAVTAVSLVELGVKIRQFDEPPVPVAPAPVPSAPAAVQVSPMSAIPATGAAEIAAIVDDDPAALAFRAAQQGPRQMRRESRIATLNGGRTA